MHVENFIYSAILCLVSIKTVVVNGKMEYAIFYEDAHFQGKSLFHSFHRCSNLPRFLNDKVSSLDSRNNCFILWDKECCQGKSIEIQSNSPKQYNDLSIIGFDNVVTSVSPCGNYSTGDSPLFLEENWHRTAEIVDKVHEDEHVTFYFDITVKRRITWPQQFIGDAWNYVKNTYGNFGPEGGRLYSIFHSENEQTSSVKTYFESAGDCRNVLDLNTPIKNGWNDPKEENMDEILQEMSKLVLTASNGIHGSPAQSFWDRGNLTDKWSEIFIYDVYMGIGLNNEAQRWFNQTINKTDNFPRKEISTNWFKDWFFNIYQKYGQSNALRSYLTTLAKNFPKNPDAPYEYEGEMNMEEYVHFWSAAVGVNLREIAAKSFGWDVTSEYQLIQAQLRFPMKYEGI